ncbi:hypothetical protein [Clostridium sp. CF012]|uniref:hypothetical protein n=1 Tax=Clostridium sp. CF012 TaxID=2843319 RepID=UPI001C0B7CF3|nr:hypothetical protein [Clostridium sp. CF012]MBU3146550.1 hypothetical protein [Clostridium sp. CF012]
MAYINKQTWEICNYNSRSNYDENEYFEVDETIALAISQLNRKGYKTSFCCSGHIFNDLSELGVAPGGHGTINGVFYEVEEDSESKKYDCIQSNGNCYISFGAHYDFSNLPKGFECNYNDDSGTILEKEYVSKDGTLEISFEIVEAMSDLYKWVLSLDEIVNL